MTRTYKRKTYKKRNSKYTELEKLAYKLGRIDKGLKNNNSRVFASYKNGVNGKTTKNRKPLI